MSNVQLTGKERSCVYRDLDTGRILSVGIDGYPPLNVPAGIRWEAIPCLHAKDLDRFMDQLRQQHKEDEEQAAVRKLEREREFRKSVRDGIIERNKKVDRWNKDVNLAALNAYDKMYDRILNQRIRAIPKLAGEMYEQGGDDSRILKDVTSGKMAR